ncbi:hypothetical protein [Marinospirillum sp.]|uniref:hypothetical protein n=1 Tax=Marinospirillum sp. TaxID=2183934 RepID=UPI0028706054|nr:hypothetical protein [Marinospirillum sp.]MDR9469268.1 hypothetical protein [Marinospirillum sp.]
MKSTDSLQSHLHECDQMPRSGVSICSGEAYFEDKDLGWLLIIERLASEEDLQENHHLEEVGESIWTTALEIKCCPYCAAVLPDARARSLADDFGYFIHIDSSGWLGLHRSF